MTEIRYPYMRLNVVAALEALSDPEYQQRVWIEHQYPQPNYYDDLKLSVHSLFDDTEVGVNPDHWVGSVLYPNEVESMRVLGEYFHEVIYDLGNLSDAEYMADPRWPEVVRLAKIALQTSQLNPVRLTSPGLRSRVEAALTRVANRGQPHPDNEDSFGLQVRLLNYDVDVCVAPVRWVGAVLFEPEVEPLRQLGEVFRWLLADPSLVVEADYWADERWPDVVRLSQVALDLMRAA